MNTGSALAKFTITLSQAVTEPVQVEWFTSDGTAKAGVDYAANKGTVLFAPGETSKTVDILVYGRAVGSEDRSFYVEMLPPTNAILGASIGECIITVDTSGSTPVTQIIVPTGPQGIQGKSAYQSYLDTTTDNPPMTEAEWVESLKGDPAEIALEVAPLIDVGATVLTAEGTETLGKPDSTTVKAVARRVAYAAPAKIATLILADGDNTIPASALTGDAIDFEALGFVPRVLHSGTFHEPDWQIESDGKLTVKAATAGDVLYAIQYSMTANKNRFASKDDLLSFENALASPLGSDEIGHGSLTVKEALDSSGIIVTPSDDLRNALLSAPEGSTVSVVGDVTLSSGLTRTSAISIDCSHGRILWSGTGSCIRFIPPVLQTYTEPVVFTGGQNHAQFPAGHTVEVGQMLCCYSNERRTGTSLGDYFRGQYLFVRKVVGQQVEFYPSIMEGFTSNKIEVRKPTAGMQHYFRLKQITPVGTPGGVIFDMSYSLNCSGYVELDCNRDPNVGFGIGGHNHSFKFNIQGITNGASGYNVMGYGIGATGTRMHFEGTGSNCRHLVEIPSGDILSADIHFDVNATKEVGNPLYLYIAGAHCNVLGWSLTGRISGSGGMVCDRSGTAHFKDIHFDCPDDGYGDGYSCISVANLYPSQTIIENITMTVSGLKRKTLVDWDIQGQGTQNGLLIIKGCITKGRCRILKIRDTGAGAKTHTYRFRIEGCSGEASSIHNRDIASSNVYMELYNNTWSTYGLDSFPDYMAGSDSTGCKVYEVHSANNVFGDINTSGVFSFDGYMDEIRFSSQADTNTDRTFIKLTPSYLGSIGRLDINGLNTMGQMTLTPTAATVYKDIGQIRFCRIGVDNVNPVNVGLSWPIIYTGNSFKTTLDATLVSTKRPQGGNVNLTNKALNWNQSNIAI